MTSPTSFEVRLTLGAESDLAAIRRNLVEYRSPASAETLLDEILQAISTLEHLPERGVAPRELSNQGIRE